MHAKFIVSTLLSLAVVASASPAPVAPTPMPAIRGVNVEERGWGDLTSLFGSLFSDVEGYVTSQGGHLYTVLSEKGHDAFTIATGAGGVVTSVGGSVFTAATGSIPTTTSSSAAYALHAGTGYLSGPALVSLVAVLTGVITGARLIS